MMEIPRATLVADTVAEKAEFLSFGTNDLTQMTFGYSRDDIGSFLPEYLESKVLKIDPFASIDQEGVGQLVQYGVERGRSTRKNPKVAVVVSLPITHDDLRLVVQLLAAEVGDDDEWWNKATRALLTRITGD